MKPFENVCPRCHGDEWVDRVNYDNGMYVRVPCPECNSPEKALLADNARLQAELAAMRQERDEMRAALDNIQNEASDARGEWLGVTEEYSPEWTHGYLRIALIASRALCDVRRGNQLDDNSASPDELPLGVQEPPQDYRIYNKRRPDGTFPPLSDFWEGKHKK